MSINIRYGSTDVELPAPRWGYETRIVLPLIITKLTPGNGYSIWDNGSNYDIRFCKCTWFLSLADTNSLIDILRNSAKGRAADLTLKLGNDSGFFPFGPDKGDSGDFIVRLVSPEPRGSIGHPADYFYTECDFVFVGSYPAYELPEAQIDGSLQIGTIGSLRYPQPMHVQTIHYGVNTVITHNASSYANDFTSTGDEYQCSMDLTQCQANAARLIDHLTGTVRANNVNIIPPANSYLFGRENGGTATYVCQWPQNEIVINHTQHDQFNFGLKFNRISG